MIFCSYGTLTLNCPCFVLRCFYAPHGCKLYELLYLFCQLEPIFFLGPVAHTIFNVHLGLCFVSNQQVHETLNPANLAPATVPELKSLKFLFLF